MLSSVNSHSIPWDCDSHKKTYVDALNIAITPILCRKNETPGKPFPLSAHRAYYFPIENYKSTRENSFLINNREIFINSFRNKLSSENIRRDLNFLIYEISELTKDFNIWITKDIINLSAKDLVRKYIKILENYQTEKHAIRGMVIYKHLINKACEELLRLGTNFSFVPQGLDHVKKINTVGSWKSGIEEEEDMASYSPNTFKSSKIFLHSDRASQQKSIKEIKQFLSELNNKIEEFYMIPPLTEKEAFYLPLEEISFLADDIELLESQKKFKTLISPTKDGKIIISDIYAFKLAILGIVGTNKEKYLGTCFDFSPIGLINYCKPEKIISFYNRDKYDSIFMLLLYKLIIKSARRALIKKDIL